MPSDPCPVWPIPQEMQLRDDALSLSRAVIVVPEHARDADLGPANLFADMIADDFGLVVPVVRGKAPDGKLPVHIRVAGQRGGGRAPRDLPGAEGYLLRIAADGAEAIGRDRRGAQYAAATMMQLAQRRDRDIVLRGVEIRDWPYKPIRMVHLYLPGEDHLAYARRYMRDFLIRYKYNGIFLELGGGVRLRNRPEIAQGWRRFADELSAIGDTGPIYGEHCPLGPGGQFSDSVHTHLADGRYLEPGDLRLLCDWARGFDLEVVPEIQSLAHVYYLACTYPEIAEWKLADFPDAYCPCNPKSYKIMFDVMSAYIDLMKCSSVHIGHDEWRAAGICPECRTKDTGVLFGEDVVKIASWLVERNLGVWMWGDHIIPKHNAIGRTSGSGVVKYVHPDTQAAAAIITRSEAARKITILNWSWYLGAMDGDRVIADMGFKQIFGNFNGEGFPGWPERSAHPSVLGAEVSSWCAWNDFELGMIHYPSAIYSANSMWSNHWPARDEWRAAAAQQFPKLRDRMRRLWEKPRLWSEATVERRKHIISIAAACNAPAKADSWDLSGLRSGRHAQDGVPFEIADADDGCVGVVVERLQKPETAYPHASAPIPVKGKYGGLIFWQVATAKGGRASHAGDGTHYPREAAELLGWYEIRFADGLTRQAEIRYHENVAAWDESHAMLYHTREVEAGALPSGKPLTIWGFEWTNPRPAVEIESVTMHGARTDAGRPAGGFSEARPMLLGITAVETRKWEDYRPGKEGKIPGIG